MNVIQITRTKKTFCWRYTKYTRKLLTVSLQASVKRTHQAEPLNGHVLAFTDGFKHSELSHFALLTSMQHEKSRREKQITVRLFSSLS